MKQVWFKRAGWIYLPVHFMGFMVSLGAIALFVPVCLDVLREPRIAVSGDFYFIFIYISVVAFWWKWIAEKTSE